MIAGIYKVEVINVSDVNFPFHKFISCGTLPILSKDDFREFDWTDLKIQPSASPLALFPKRKMGGSVFISTIQLKILDAKSFVDVWTYNETRVLVLITDNNDNVWLLGSPSTPVLIEVGINIDAEVAAENFTSVKLNVNQISPPILLR